MAETDESMEGGEEYVAETETSQVEGGDETDENNTTYNTDAVEEEVPTQVDPDGATLEDIFGADDPEEESTEQQNIIPEEEPLDDYDEVHYAKQQQAIGSPLRLVTNPLPTPQEDNMVVRVKLPNIIGIQSKPFTHQSLEEELNNMYEEDDDEGRRKKHGIAESQIRWRYVDGMKDVKESNARVVRWSDGSMHLMLGNEMLDMTMHDLAVEHLYLYARQPGFLHSQGRLNKKVVIRPASLDNKLHQKLSMSLAERNQKVSKVKLVTTTMDPEIEKAQKEKAEEEKIKKAQGETAARNKIMRSYGLDAAYLEQTGEYDEPPPMPTYRRERERERNSYRDNKNLDDFIVDDESDEDEEEERRSKKNKRRHEEDTDRLMNAKRDLSPEPKKRKEKEKEKRKVRKGEERKEEEEEGKEEEDKEEETTATTTEGGTQAEETGGDFGEEEEEVNIVKKPAKRRGVVIDDDEAET